MNFFFKWLPVFMMVFLSACGAQDVKLDIQMQGEGTIRSPGGVECSEPCITTVKINPPFIGDKYVKLTATAAPGYQFLGWNHLSCSESEVCNLAFSGICADQITCSTGINYDANTIKPVFVDSSLLLDASWSERAVCAAFSSGQVQCWGHHFQSEVEAVPPLNNPQKVAVGSSVACAQVDEGIRCWGSAELIPKDAPMVLPPLEMEMLGSSICVLDQEGVKCWGRSGPLQTPDLADPENLRKRAVKTADSTRYEFCVDDAAVEVCW